MAVPRENYLLAQILKEPADPYYAAFGRFITGFARSEGVVRSLLEKLVGVSGQESAALFARLMVGDTMGTINRILATRKANGMAAAIKEPFAHLQAIGDVRNALVHWGGTLDQTEGVFVRTNTHRAHLPTNVVEYRVDLDQLAHMTADLIKIDMHLLTAMDQDQIGTAIMTKIIQPVLDAAWLYIPPEPAAQGKSSSPERLQ
jgi:hypothetical protein